MQGMTADPATGISAVPTGMQDGVTGMGTGESMRDMTGEMMKRQGDWIGDAAPTEQLKEKVAEQLTGKQLIGNIQRLTGLILPGGSGIRTRPSTPRQAGDLG